MASPEPPASRTSTVTTFAELAEHIRSRPPRLGDVRLVAVDGPGGAGKSVFARRLAAALGGVAVVQTDDFASWDVPLEWWPRLERELLEPLAAGQTARYEASDWSGRGHGEQREVEPGEVVILEGVSSSRRAVVDRLSLAVWVETPADRRLARGLERDGHEALEQWRSWMAEEDAHFARDGQVGRADVIVDGAPTTVPHDPEREFIRLR